MYSGSEPKVIIIVVNWNGRDDTLACINSLRSVNYQNYEIILVDNGSEDGLIEEIEREAIPVTILENGENLGFVGGNNSGIRYALSNDSDYILLLNNDTEVDVDFLKYLVDAAEKEASIGITGPMIYYHSQPNIIWSAGGKIDLRTGITEMIGLDKEDCGQFGLESKKVDFVTGCCLLIRTEAVRRIGLLDERFFAYYEETEWCVRATRAGFRIKFVPESKVWHKINPAAREASPQVNYYMTRNRLLFLHLTHAGIGAWLNTLVRDYLRTYLSWTLKPKWRHKASQKRALVQGVLDFSRGRFGKVDFAG